MVAVVAAGSSGDVDDALLARVAQILGGSSGGGSSSGGFGRSSFSGSSSGYSAPSSSYGAPSDSGAIAIGRSAGRSGGAGGVQIGNPERAQRVAEFELSSGGSAGGRSAGGFSSGYSAPSQSYGAPSSGGFGRSAGGAGGIDIGRPERAQRVAEFDLSGGSAGGSRSGGGYQ